MDDKVAAGGQDACSIKDTAPGAFPAKALFEPESVAVVGVPRTLKPGQIFLLGLLNPGYRGRIYPVNPNAEEIAGLRCYPSVSSLPETPDLAIIVVPTAAAVPVVAECAEKGVKAAVLFTAGFSEAGTEEGRQREAEALAAARRTGMRLQGPNCMGLYVPKSGLAMFPAMPPDVGPISFVSQSGSLCSFLVGVGHGRGLAFSKVVSIGNQADLEASDFFEFLADDPETEVVGAYIEGAKDGRRLRRAMERVAQRKRLVVWKAGRTASGAKAANSHTGSLSGEAEVWSGLLRQVGAIQARDMDEMVDVLVACRYVPPDSGRRIAILAGPGGPAVSASDACEENGLTLAQLSAGTQEVLRAIIPAAGTSVRNPVDMGMVIVGTSEIYYRATEATAMDPNVDALLVIGGAPMGGTMEPYAATISDISRRTGKPIMQSSVGGGEILFDKAFARHGVPSYSSPERALWAYSRATRRVIT
ncbi:MAG: CoA-binding protein [Dehalococcoidia bacterium]|nr:CoA-binding protein [Dehalococcoidia bacterium]